MIIFVEDGKLGNQLFQYSALRSLFRDEDIVLFGFDEIFDMFNSVKAKHILSNKSYVFKFIKYIVPILDTILLYISNVLYITKIFKDKSPNTIYFDFIFLKYIYKNYFQAEKFIDNILCNEIEIKNKYQLKASNIIKNKLPTSCIPIFVHIRRADYLTFPTPKTAAVLPAKWYHDCINELSNLYSSPFFVFCTDDVQYVKNHFGKMTNLYISTNNFQIDFALMTQCQAGILSPSSFSWWSAYFSKLNNPEGMYIAPDYWIGHQKNEWFPKDIKTSFLEYRNVGYCSDVNQ